MSGPPPGPTVEEGIEQVLSANDSEVYEWINRNDRYLEVLNEKCSFNTTDPEEETKLSNDCFQILRQVIRDEREFGENDKSCSKKITNAQPVNLSDWVLENVYSNYSLYKLSQMSRKGPPIHFFAQYNDQVGIIREMWLIATNREINFSTPRNRSHANSKQFSNVRKNETCRSGIAWKYHHELCQILYSVQRPYTQSPYNLLTRCYNWRRDLYRVAILFNTLRVEVVHWMVFKIANYNRAVQYLYCTNLYSYSYTLISNENNKRRVYSIINTNSLNRV